MKNPILKEIRRVTGWHFLIDHEAFPLLLAAMSATNILWFYPGIERIHAAYFPAMHQAAVVRAMPQAMPVAPTNVLMEAPTLEVTQPL